MKFLRAFPSRCPNCLRIREYLTPREVDDFGASRQGHWTVPTFELATLDDQAKMVHVNVTIAADRQRFIASTHGVRPAAAPQRENQPAKKNSKRDRCR